MTTALLRRAARKAAERIDFARATRLYDAAVARYPRNPVTAGSALYQRDLLALTRTANDCRRAMVSA